MEDIFKDLRKKLFDVLHLYLKTYGARGRSVKVSIPKCTILLYII